jgi:2-hydroxychromene-2-carboxylate isomerase
MVKTEMADIEFFFDCSSPWTYLAFHNIQPLAAECGATIAWRPILVGGIFNTVNPSVYASRQNGITIAFPPTVFPVNSVKAMRGCLLLEPDGKLEAFARAAFEAYFGDDQDISQDDVLRRICAGLDIDADKFLAGIATPAIKDKLKANTDEVIRRGGFGSPTMFVGGSDMYFGNDRLPLVREALALRNGRTTALGRARR